jgi:hypothetical protein
MNYSSLFTCGVNGRVFACRIECDKHVDLLKRYLEQLKMIAGVRGNPPCCSMANSPGVHNSFPRIKGKERTCKWTHKVGIIFNVFRPALVTSRISAEGSLFLLRNLGEMKVS